MQSTIILSTLNAKYAHSAFGLRYLKANLKELEEQTEILEFSISDSVRDIAEKLLSKSPQIIGLGVYIWNIQPITMLANIIKHISPETVLILGGPEVSYEWEEQEIFKCCDYLVCGEGEEAFYELCRSIVSGKPIFNKVHKKLPEIQSIQFPYYLYTDEDICHRLIYVEASRGCVFKCQFCLSSLDNTVRVFDLDAFLSEMEILISRGARHFKFVDRTFNLKIDFS